MLTHIIKNIKNIKFLTLGNEETLQKIPKEKVSKIKV